MTPTSIVLLAACPLACGLATGRPAAAPSVAAPACARAPARTTRRGFGTVLGAAALSPLLSACSAETGASSLNYKVLQQGKGQVPVVGELVVLRWQASFNGKVFDDLYQKNDYYYHRVGSGNLVPGVEEAVKLMHVGDIWQLELTGEQGFGKSGKKATPGQPSIPPNAPLTYKLELVSLPGREDELLEVTGGDPSATSAE